MKRQAGLRRSTPLKAASVALKRSKPVKRANSANPNRMWLVRAAQVDGVSYFPGWVDVSVFPRLREFCVRAKPRRGRERSAAETLRIYGPPERRAWIQGRECLVCGSTPCENVHTRSGGTGRKADACFIVALCPAHHRELHQHGQNTFEIKYGLDLVIHAMLTDIIWQRRQERGA